MTSSKCLTRSSLSLFIFEAFAVNLCQRHKINLLMSLLEFSFSKQYYIYIFLPIIRTYLSFSLDYSDQYLKEWWNDFERTLAWNDIIIVVSVSIVRNRTERQWYCFLMNVTTDRSTSLTLKNKSPSLRSNSMSGLVWNVLSSVISPYFWRWAHKHSFSLIQRKLSYKGSSFFSVN